MDGGGGSGGRVSMATTQHLGRSLFRAGSFLFLSPHFVFIYSALLFSFSTERLYPPSPPYSRF